MKVEIEIDDDEIRGMVHEAAMNRYSDLQGKINEHVRTIFASLDLSALVNEIAIPVLKATIRDEVTIVIRREAAAVVRQMRKDGTLFAGAETKGE